VEKVISEFSKSTGKNSNYGLNREILVGKSGYLLVKANVIKQTTATVFVGVNSGFNHLIRPMFYDSYHVIENLSNPKERKEFIPW
jgi:diaminopimelate decarboxylase